MHLPSKAFVFSCLPLLGRCLAPPVVDRAARLFGQRQQQEPVFETDGRPVDGREGVGDDDGWGDWVRDKYVVQDPFDEDFDRMVEETLAHWHVPGLSVAVVHGDATFAKGYGKAILPDVDATPDTLYYVGSTTKSFTAAAILLLIDDSRLPSSPLPPNLDLTTPVSSLIRADFVLPDPYATSKATLEDLLTHRTGMPRHDLALPAAATTTLRHHVRNLRHLPLTADLRTTWQYCNMMYTALAHVLESLTSTTWAEFVTSRIWRPLAMTNTFASLAAARAHPTARHHLSAPYYWHNASASFVREPHLPDSPALTGAGNVLSSVADYAKYLRALLRRRPNFFAGPDGFRQLRKAARSVVVDPGDDEDDEERGGSGKNAPWVGPELYGLGWTLQTYRVGGLRVYAHGGAVTGYAAEMAYVPEAGWGVAVMANTEVKGGWAAERVLVRLVEGLAGTAADERWDAVGVIDGRVAKLREGRARARETLFPGAPERPREGEGEGEGGEGGWLPLVLPLERYAGTFANDGYGRVTFAVEDGHGGNATVDDDEEGGGSAGAGYGGYDGIRGRHLHASVADRLWPYTMCLEHVSGEFFMAWLGATKDFPNGLFDDEMPLKARFDVGVSGKVERLFLGLEPRMGDEMMVFTRVDE
ncbi:penicillin-binding protein [Diplodia corticola]|uniref:Penicillin-binding protein n=1 Tax=Diplodia corticola TaxID=236234 RepID=A0A1J9QNW0_9PEZI|nr:penicillin-binding protein [Diplodia corticola]OJD30137.1 penicillin-binding protein [Diplodia corticola]